MDERIITTNKVNFPNIRGLGKWLFDQLQKAASKNKIAQVSIRVIYKVGE